MKRHIALGTMAWLFVACAALVFTPARSQQITHVDFNLPAFDYDVIYLADFIDVASNKLAKDIPNFSGTITANGNGQIVLYAEADIRLKGEAQDWLAKTTTKPFTLNGSRTITANDLAGGITDIDSKIYEENTALRSKLEDYAKTFPTAPVGDYILILQAWNANPDGSKGNTLLGQTQKTVTVRNASPEEVQVNLIDPQPGATISTTVPTFSWTCQNPNVTLYVYEKLPIYQSLQEAITGVPYLKQDVTGAQTFTYPPNASRLLQVNKEYVWFVEASVVTNRQSVVRRSEVRLFRISLDNRQSQDVSDIMNNFGGSASGTFSTLQSIGWTPSGTMTLDGRTITLDDLKTLVTRLLNQNTPVSIRVE